MDMITKVMLMAFAGCVICILVIIYLSKVIKKKDAAILYTREKANQEIATMRNDCAVKIEAIKKQSEEALQQAKVQIQTIQKQSEEILKRERQENEEKLRQKQEFIESRRKVLLCQSEKELLVDTIMALEGYATRISRIEEKFDSIEKLDLQIQTTKKELQENISNSVSTFQSALDAMAKGLQVIFPEAKKLSNAIREISEAIKGLSSDISEIDTDVYVDNDSIGEILRIVERIDDHVGDSWESLHGKVDDLLSKYN